MYKRTEEVSWWSNTKSIGKIWIRPYLDIALSSSTFYCKKHLCLLMSGWCYFEGVWIMSRWCLRVSGEASMPNLFMILRYCLSSSARNSYHLNPVLSAAVRILESFDMMIMSGKVKCSVWWLSTYSMMIKRIELHEAYLTCWQKCFYMTLNLPGLLNVLDFKSWRWELIKIRR